MRRNRHVVAPSRNAKRALTDGVVATPTLIGLADDKRITFMGDLADQSHLKQILEDLLWPADRT
jgi:hypothetical protein